MLGKVQSVLAKSKDALIFMAIIVFAMFIAHIVENTNLLDWLFIPAMAILIAFVMLELVFLWHALQCARKEERYGKR